MWVNRIRSTIFHGTRWVLHRHPGAAHYLAHDDIVRDEHSAGPKPSGPRWYLIGREAEALVKLQRTLVAQEAREHDLGYGGRAGGHIL